MQLQWFNQRQRTAQPLPQQHTPTVELNLIAAQGSQAIVDVAPDDGTALYQSAIVQVDAQAGTALIDELFPTGAALRPGQAATLALRLEGGRRERFRVRVIEVRRERGATNYLLKLPPNVGYIQRRAAYRLKLEPHWGVNAEFFLRDFGRHTAAVQDLSSLGIRLALSHWLPFKAGDVLQQLSFVFAGAVYSCDATVRNVRDHGGQSAIIGAAFVDLARPQQRALERAIMQMQRRQVQRLTAAG
jgi:c-di-GMP-binding flagellar brake protein YcgR